MNFTGISIVRNGVCRILRIRVTILTCGTLPNGVPGVWHVAYLVISGIGLGIFWTHHPAAVRAGLLDYVAAQSRLTLLFLLGMRSLVWTFFVQPLQHQTTYDRLTGVCRPGAFWERAEHQVAQAFRLHQPITFVFLDLDNFKALNDTQGHAAGDAVLHTFATVLRQSARHSDTLGRLGGDKFGWLLRYCRTGSVMRRKSSNSAGY